MNKSEPKSTPSIETMSYEQALSELESIVAALEAGEGNLGDSLALFERGQSLALRCTRLLDEAELTVRQLSGENLVEFKPPDPAG